MFIAMVTFAFLAAVGYALARTGVMTGGGIKALNGFVLYAVMPATVFITLATSAELQVAVSHLAAFGVTSLACMTLGVFAVRATGTNRRDALLVGVASGYTNSGNIGIPVALHLFHREELAVAVIAMQVTIFLPTLITILGANGTAGGFVGWVRAMLRVALRNPVILACGAGLAFQITGLPLPQVVQVPVGTLAAAAASAPLVAVGASLHGAFEGFKAVSASVAVATLVKVIAHPLLLWCLLVVVLGVDQGVAAPWVVFAALPTAQIMGVLAIAHDRAPQATNVLIAVSTVCGLLIAPLVWWALQGT